MVKYVDGLDIHYEGGDYIRIEKKRCKLFVHYFDKDGKEKYPYFNETGKIMGYTYNKVA